MRSRPLSRPIPPATTSPRTWSSPDENTTAPAVADRIEKIIKDVAQSNTGDFALDSWTSASKLASLTGNPLTIKMPKVDGTAFSTESLKGKVILVDIWATWCGPCMRVLPHVVKIYQKYHGQGLEVVGVSCDSNADDLKSFLQITQRNYMDTIV